VLLPDPVVVVEPFMLLFTPDPVVVDEPFILLFTPDPVVVVEPFRLLFVLVPVVELDPFIVPFMLLLLFTSEPVGVVPGEVTLLFVPVVVVVDGVVLCVVFVCAPAEPAVATTRSAPQMASVLFIGRPFLWTVDWGSTARCGLRRGRFRLSP
jgi:hypothetical protein